MTDRDEPVDAVRNGRAAGSGAPVDLDVEGGRFVSGWRAHSERVLDLDQAVALPGLVEPHVHLDKAFLSARLQAVGGGGWSLRDAIAATATLRASFTRADIVSRASLLLERLAAHGVCAARVHVEIEPTLGLLGVEAHLELRETWSRVMELQLVAFPQNGLGSGTEELLEEAMRMGCDVVGGCPYVDADQAAHLDAVFALAERWRAPVDLHVDFTDDASSPGVDLVTERTRALGLAGRVAVGHVTALAAMDPDAAARRADDLADAGVHVVSLPQTDLFLGGRSGRQERPGALAPIRMLRDHGVNVCVGTNNIGNAFTPLGRPAPLTMAWLAAVAGHMSGPADTPALLDMVTKNPARMLGYSTWDLCPGSPADLVVLDTDSPDDLVASDPAVLGSMHAGLFRPLSGPRHQPMIKRPTDVEPPLPRPAAASL